jgi:hypothetical protein
LYAARGDDSRMARELSALAAIQFRSGNLERALDTIESALPLYTRSRDQADHASALRLAGNARPSSAATIWRSTTCTARSGSTGTV